ncbi:MAG TPA: glycosyltransferase [Gallionellaceae bacterium]
MNILILEAELIGHHPIYLERIARAHLEMGRKVTVAVSEQYASHQLLDHLGRLYDDFRVETISDAQCRHALNSKFGNIGREIAFWRVFRQVYIRVAARQHVDYVFLPYLDYCLYAFGLLGSPFGASNWGGICMRPSFHFKQMAVVAPPSPFGLGKKWLFERVMRLPTMLSMFTIDQTLAFYYIKRPVIGSAKLAYLADPAEAQANYPQSMARRALGMPDTGSTILVYGALDSRKGIRQLIQGMLHEDAPRDLNLLIVGEQSPEIQKLLCSDLVAPLRREGKLYQLDNFVSDEQERLAFSASNIAWLGYSGHYTMSGVLVKAVQHGLVILGTNQGLIGWHIKGEKLGAAVDIQDPASVARALSWCLHHGGLSGELQASWKDSYSWEEAVKVLLKRCGSVATN